MASPALARALPARLPALGFRQEPATELLPTGLDSVDALLGGFPRGRISEISGPASSGRTSLLHRILAAAGARGEYCAVIDTSDNFDPTTAAASGVSLETLVWIRCNGHLEHATRATDLLLHGGGFGVVALDLCDVSPEAARRMPISYWHRFRLAVENSTSAFLVVTGETQAKSCAALSVSLARREANFTGRNPYYLLESATYTLESRKPMRMGDAGFTPEARHVS